MSKEPRVEPKIQELNADALINSLETKKLNYQIHTFGCKVNTYDTSLLEKKLTHFTKKNKISKNNDNTVKDPLMKSSEDFSEDVHVLNSCAVTFEATKEAARLARRIKKKNPNSTVVLTGCAAQVDRKYFADEKAVDLVIGNSHKSDINNLIQRKLDGMPDRVFHENIFKKEDLEFGAGLESSKTRAFLKIQDGCNSFCSFCVIPFARGKSRSIPVKDLVNKVNEFFETGLKEVILTGVHIGDYEDGDHRIEDLIDALLKQTQMPRFRLTSLEPVELSPRLLALYQDDRMCAHFHMSIQSAQTKVLTEMKRNYSAKEVEWSLTEIQKQWPKAFVGMDVIVGFPGETEEEFQETYDRLKSLPWTRIHVFPYSPRPMTKGARMEDQLDRSLILQRSKKLRNLSDKRWQLQAKEQIGSQLKVLPLAKREAGFAVGLSRNYWNVLFDPKILDSRKDPSEEIELSVKDFIFKDNSRGYLVAD